MSMRDKGSRQGLAFRLPGGWVLVVVFAVVLGVMGAGVVAADPAPVVPDDGAALRAQVDTLSRLLRELEARADNLQEALDLSEEKRREADLLRDGRAIRERLSDPNSQELVSSLNDAGMVMALDGRIEESRLLFERALAIADRKQDPMHPARGTLLQNLGEILLAQGKPDAAERFREAAMVFGKAAGATHPRMAAVLNSWAMSLAVQGQVEEAESLYRRAIRIYESQKDRLSSDRAVPLHNYGLLLLNQGRTAEAGDRLDEALALLKKNRQEQTPLALAVLRALARQRRDAGLHDEGVRFEEQAGAVVVKQMDEALDGR
jgi:tetratricopeptide (TPR) repeat protein